MNRDSNDIESERNDISTEPSPGAEAVSYTHLTLPTKA